MDNIEIHGIPNNIDDHHLEEKVIKIAKSVNVNIKEEEIEATRNATKEQMYQKELSSDLQIERHVTIYTSRKSYCTKGSWQQHFHQLKSLPIQQLYLGES